MERVSMQSPFRSTGLVLTFILLLAVLIISVGMFRGGNDEDGNNGDVDVAGQQSDTDAVAETPSLNATPASGDGEPVDTSDGVDPDGHDDAAPTDDEHGDSEPANYPELTAEELQRYQPNELGQVMVIMYHRIIEGSNDVYVRSPDQFRGDLQWLYDNNFYVIPIRDYIRNEIKAPPGKRPVILTFDDGPVDQFRFIVEADGTKRIDPNSAVGILEEFFTRYDDFGRGGLFAILPLAPFAWPEAPDQMEFAQEKLQWLVDNGYELGNHTVGHVNLREISDDQIKSELARAVDMMREHVPGVEVNVLSVPFGVYPAGGDTSIFHGFEYEGREYALEGALMVGAEPGVSPVHAKFNPMWIPRIRADDEELGRWFAFVEANPGIMYVSDGNPDTITIPEDIHPWLVGTFDEAKAEGKTVIRY
jgi:peptidoglycan/xylan/chitin deacetylase (PgdA/CDA1 family)